MLKKFSFLSNVSWWVWAACAYAAYFVIELVYKPAVFAWLLKDFLLWAGAAHIVTAILYLLVRMITHYRVAQKDPVCFIKNNWGFKNDYRYGVIFGSAFVVMKLYLSA